MSHRCHAALLLLLLMLQHLLLEPTCVLQRTRHLPADYRCCHLALTAAAAAGGAAAGGCQAVLLL
jgi:hypothetical protein